MHMAKETEQKGSSITLHAHGDGSYHTISHGPHDYMSMERGKEPGRKDHATFGAAIMHVAKMHGPPGDHLHVHGHDEGYTSHNVMDHQRVRGPVESKSGKDLGAHVSSTMEAGED